MLLSVLVNPRHHSQSLNDPTRITGWLSTESGPERTKVSRDHPLGFLTGVADDRLALLAHKLLKVPVPASKFTRCP